MLFMLYVALVPPCTISVRWGGRVGSSHAYGTEERGFMYVRSLSSETLVWKYMTGTCQNRQQAILLIL